MEPDNHYAIVDPASIEEYETKDAGLKEASWKFEMADDIKGGVIDGQNN